MSYSSQIRPYLEEQYRQPDCPPSPGPCCSQRMAHVEACCSSHDEDPECSPVRALPPQHECEDDCDYDHEPPRRHHRQHHDRRRMECHCRSDGCGQIECRCRQCRPRPRCGECRPRHEKVECRCRQCSDGCGRTKTVCECRRACKPRRRRRPTCECRVRVEVDPCPQLPCDPCQHPWLRGYPHTARTWSGRPDNCTY